MTDIFCLSDMIAEAGEFRKDKEVISSYVVKEFIKRLKEDIRTNPNWVMCWEECIDKIAGDRLI